MSETIKCTCSHCGAKYRLPVEAQGRSARCKRCGEKFEIPQVSNLEDTVLDWLAAPVEDDVEEVPSQPRVISMPDQAGTDDSSEGESPRRRGPIRMKGEDKSAGETQAQKK